LNFSRFHVHNFNGDFLKSLFATYSVYARNASIANRSAVMFIVKKTAVIYSLGHGLCAPSCSA